MKLEFDSNNATELRAVEAAVAVLLDRLPRVVADNFKSPLEAAVADAQQRLNAWDSSGAPMVGAGEANDAIGPTRTCEAKQSVVVQTESGVHKLQTGVHNLGDVTVSVALPGEETTLPELDSAGQPWTPELHSSSRAKVADGTWKKKRGAGKPTGVDQLLDAVLAPANALIDAARGRDPLPEVLTADGQPTPEVIAKVLENVASTTSVPPIPAAPQPPAPPVPVAPAAPAPTSAEQKIWALISSEVVTVNQALEAARAAGLADLGALRQADEAKKLEVLRVLEGE